MNFDLLSDYQEFSDLPFIQTSEEEAKFSYLQDFLSSETQDSQNPEDEDENLKPYLPQK